MPSFLGTLSSVFHIGSSKSPEPEDQRNSRAESESSRGSLDEDQQYNPEIHGPITTRADLIAHLRDPVTRKRGRRYREDLTELMDDSRDYETFLERRAGRPKKPKPLCKTRLESVEVSEDEHSILDEGIGFKRTRLLTKSFNKVSTSPEFRRTKSGKIKKYKRTRNGESSEGFETGEEESSYYEETPEPPEVKKVVMGEAVDDVYSEEQPKILPVKPKRGRGRPRKIHRDWKPSVKVEPKKPPVRPTRARKVVAKVVESSDSDSDSDPNDAYPNFVFIKLTDSRIVKPRRKAVQKKSEEVIQLDPFQSPKKQRIGVLQLDAAPVSPSKRGIISLAPSKTPNGRAGSPRKVRQQITELQDKSARKKMNKKLYAILDDGLEELEDEGFQDDVRVAERIIRESKQSDTPAATTPLHTPRKNTDLPTHNPDFVPTPLPTAKDEADFLDARYEDKALFLDGPDGYFDQHRLKVRTSNNSMVQAPSLDYDEFNSLILLSGFLHHDQKSRLIESHTQMYTQWLFELEQGFNLLFYGVGSKRAFMLSFLQDYLIEKIPVPTLVVNGYNPLVNFTEVLKQVVTTLKLTKVPKRTGELIDHLTKHFQKRKDKSSKLIILWHNIDAEPLRDEKIQDYISKLAAIPQIHLIASIDHINAPLLWDSIRLAKLNFVWHNITTFADYITEISFRDPLALGHTQKSAGAKGAKFVLSSLTHNSKELYRVLASNQLQTMEDDLATREDKGTVRGSIKHALEFSRFFHLCAEEFISSNEINFRTMLVEFLEHKMAVLQKDPAGTEMVFIPFTFDEIQKLLVEEL